MVLSKRQEIAQNLTRELGRLGANVTNVLPLDDAARLRFWVSDYKKREVLQQLADAGYEPMFLGMSPQICTESYSMGLVNNFELDLPHERQPVADDRKIQGEIARPKKSNVEVEGIMKYLGWSK